MKVLVDKDFLEEGLELICGKIREKTGGTGELAFPAEMAAAVESIAGSGGITPTGTKEIEVTEDDVTVEVAGFENAHITLNLTEAMEITENGTYDVKLYGSAEVDVPQVPTLMDGGSTTDDGYFRVQPADSRHIAVSDIGFDGTDVVGCFIKAKNGGIQKFKIYAMFIIPMERTGMGEYRAYYFSLDAAGNIDARVAAPRSGKISFSVGEHTLSVSLANNFGTGEEFLTGEDYDVYPIRGGGR